MLPSRHPTVTLGARAGGAAVGVSGRGHHVKGCGQLFVTVLAPQYDRRLERGASFWSANQNHVRTQSSAEYGEALAIVTRTDLRTHSSRLRSCFLWSFRFASLLCRLHVRHWSNCRAWIAHAADESSTPLESQIVKRFGKLSQEDRRQIFPLRATKLDQAADLTSR